MTIKTEDELATARTYLELWARLLRRNRDSNKAITTRKMKCNTSYNISHRLGIYTFILHSLDSPNKTMISGQ